MPQEEVFGTRDRTYSAWHRRMSTQRFVGIEFAQLLAMIDLDASLYVEYDDRTKEPLALIETAADHGQLWKPATVTAKLARRADLPGFVALYTKSAHLNPADLQFFDIDSFRARRLWPQPTNDWKRFTAQEWAEFLVRLRGWSARRLDEQIKGNGGERKTKG